MQVVSSIDTPIYSNILVQVQLHSSMSGDCKPVITSVVASVNMHAHLHVLYTYIVHPGLMSKIVNGCNFCSVYATNTEQAALHCT